MEDSKYLRGIHPKDDIKLNIIPGNPFALFQDKIVTGAFRRQMKNNGITPTITHNDDLGFHIMDLDENSQLLIKERGSTNLRESGSS